MAQFKRFVFLTDLHWGYERRNGHKVPIHDIKALNATLAFIEDFKPHHVILGGDMLDAGAVSHHTKLRPGENEGLRLAQDCTELKKILIRPLEALVPGRLIYHIGNHEDWLDDLVMEIPALEGILDVRSLLSLSSRWEVIPVGGVSRVGKLHFVHGDNISGGENVAKGAVINYEESIRFGHFHTLQTFTKNSPIGNKTKTGTAVPCLCRKDLSYGKGRPNKWAQGFLWGHVDPKNGNFYDYVTVIVDGKFVAPNGKAYGG